MKIRRQKTSVPSQNVFRYIPFTEQISKVSADVLNWKLASRNVVLENTTYFHDAVAFANDMDNGSYYKAFLEDIHWKNGELLSYAQFLYHQKRIAEALVKHLSIETSSSIQTMLDLCIAFIRDLREDSYDYLWPFFNAIIGILERAHEQSDLLQSGFHALAILFKLQWRRIVKELRRTFVYFVPLFGSARDYIRRFAAEAFAFLLRKSHNIPKLTTFLMETAEKTNDRNLMDGVALLLFNSVKGVSHQFHSSASQILTDILSSVLKLQSERTRQVATQILEKFMESCVMFTSQEFSSPIFDVILNMFAAVSSSSTSSAKDVALLSCMLRIWITSRRGVTLSSPSQLTEVLCSVVSKNSWTPHDDVLCLISETVSMYHEQSCTQSLLKAAINKIIDRSQSCDFLAVIDFVNNLSDVPLFDLWFMPTIGRYFEKIIESGDENHIAKIFNFYATLCVKRRPLESIKQHERNLFFDVSCHRMFRELLVSVIQKSDVSKNEVDRNLICAITIYPWLWREAEEPQAVDSLLKLLRAFLSMKSYSFSSQLAWLTVHTISLINVDLLSSFDLESILSLIRKTNCDECSLRVFRTILPHIKDFDTNDAVLFVKIAREVKQCFAHWNTKIRQEALQILAGFTLPNRMLTATDEATVSSENVFELLLLAERTPCTLNEYRTRLSLLRRLKYGSHAKYLPECNSDFIDTIPLMIVIAQLYERFTILWPQLFEIIESYAYGMNLDVFWPVFFGFIENATKEIGLLRIKKVAYAENETFALLRKVIGIEQPNPTDCVTFRLQLLTFLQQIADIAERRTVALSPLLLEIYRNEYQTIDIQSQQRQNLTGSGLNDNDDPEDVADEQRMLEESTLFEKFRDVRNGVACYEKYRSDSVSEGSPKKDLSNNQRNRSHIHKQREVPMLVNRVSTKKAMVAILETYAKFANPKAIFMKQEIRDLYDEMLMIPDETVQKAVLKCLFSYKYKFLNPYKENFESLVNNRTFLNELVRFGIDEQGSVVAEGHRSGLVPILMRLLCGKMKTHITKDAVTWRSAIFRFLAGCHPHELDIFVAILFGPLIEFSGSEGEEFEKMDSMCERLLCNFDITSVIPLRKLKSCLNNIAHVIKNLSPVLHYDQQAAIYRLCIIVAVNVRLMFEKKDQIRPKYLQIIKDLRQLVCQRFEEFFDAFQHRSFTSSEINSLMKYFIAPLCSVSASNSSVEAPLSVLHLFASWTNSSVLFYLLQVRLPLSSSETMCPISILCDALLLNSSNKSVKNFVVDSLLNLLITDNGKACRIPVDLDIVPYKEVEGVTRGTSLVLSNLSSVVSYLYKCLSSSDSKRIDPKHLDVLYRICEYVKESDISERFATTLITYAEAGTVRSEAILQTLLQTTGKLITSLADPFAFIRHVVHLSSSLKSQACRDSLMSIVESLAVAIKPKDSDMSTQLSLVIDLNAWDRTKFSEPDFSRRHGACDQLNKLWDAKSVFQPAILQIIAHNFFFFMSEVNELSFRSATVHSFRQMIRYLGDFPMKESSKSETVDKHVLPLILKGLRHDKEVVRHDFVSLLVTLIIAFPTHKILKPLVALRNVDEPDLDFFENVCHIQMHRRQRALRRLTDSLRAEQISLPLDVMWRVLLPIIQPYLTDLNSKTSALSDEAIRMLSQILSKAPWRRYFPMLEFYLNKLEKSDEKHKAFVRVIVAIIDAFHFEITDEAAREWGSTVERKRPQIESVDRKDIIDEEKKKQNEDSVFVVCAEDEVESEEKSTKANRIQEQTLKYLLPKLKKIATGKDLCAHKKARVGKYYSDDEMILRAPLALATVKLLQKMPDKIVDEHLHSIILKLCSLLMSRSIDVRKCARTVLVDVASSLGPRYLPFIIRELKQIMIRGYQVHVMIFSCHTLISSLTSSLKTGDLDTILEDLIEICNKDLFGDVAEEKQVTQITKDVPEAKANKTYETFSLIGRFVGPNRPGIVVQSMIEVLEARPTATVVRRVADVLRFFAVGLSHNQGIDAQTMLIFSHQTIKPHINEVIGIMAKKSDDEKDKIGRPTDNLLLEKEPGRIGVITKTSVKSKMSVIVEFGLRVLSMLLKEYASNDDDSRMIASVDPFVPIITETLKMKYDKIVSFSLRCLISLFNYPLPSLHSHLESIVDQMFILLSNYTGIGDVSSKGVITELTQLLFKAFTRLIRDVPDLVLSPERIQLLLSFIETDIIGTQRQATAFALLKVIIARKLKDPKIPDLIQYLSEIAITSELPHVRAQCRQVILQFVGNHPQCQRPRWYIEFFNAQLEYEFEDGRVSAIEMLASLFDSLVNEVNDEYCVFSLIGLSMRLANDESQKCRKLAALAIRKLLASVSDGKRNDLFLVAKDWLESPKELNQSLGLQVLVEFSEIKSGLSLSQISEIFTVIATILKPSIITEYSETSTTSLLDSFTTLARNLSSISYDSDSLKRIGSILVNMDEFLHCSDSVAIQLSASYLCGQLFSCLDASQLRELNDDLSARKVCEWMIWQLRGIHVTAELADQISRNIVFLSRGLTCEDLQWLCNKLSSICKFEVVKRPNEATKRLTILKLAAALLLQSEPSNYAMFSDAFVPIIYRELSGMSAKNTEELIQLSQEVGEVFKEKLGDESYSRKLAECKLVVAKKFELRKRKNKELAVVDPAAAALRKYRKHQLKIKARKRKLDIEKPYRKKRKTASDS